MRTIAIGDVHGCSTALRTLLDAIQPQATDRLVFLGDYVDRGPDSRGVLEQLIELQSKCQLTLIRGNHEIMFVACAKQGIDIQLWLLMGGRATLASYGGSLQDLPPKHLELLQTCVPFYENETHIFLHANYMPQLSMQDQPERTLFWEHLTDPLPEPHLSGKTMVVGHTPQVSGEILNAGHLICLDTHCFGGQWLSAIEMETQETWQANQSGSMRSEYSAFGRWLMHMKRFLIATSILIAL